MISIVITARNDNHLNFFKKRMIRSVLENSNLLKKHNQDFEYIIVDWASDRPLYQDQDMTEVSKLVKYFIVSSDTVIKKFKVNRFYQFFAKNVGIRKAKGDWLLLINGDNLLSESLILKMKDIITQNNDNRFFRTKYWIDVDENNNVVKKMECDDRKIILSIEHGLAPIYSGDFLFCKTEKIIQCGKGYDEGNLKHQTELPQAYMDSEILHNLKKNGIFPFILDDSIIHQTHPRSPKFDDSYIKDGYENTQTWGMIDTKEKQISENIIELIY